MKLTAAIVRSAGIPPGKSEAIFFDDDVPGFGLRVREAGSRSFVFQYKLGSKQRRMALGTATALNFSSVRKTAETLYARVKLGQDPAGEKNHARLKATETFEAVVRRHLDDKRKEMRPRSFAQVERHLLKQAKALHSLQFEKISRQDIAACVRSVRDNSGVPSGNRVSSSLSGLFSWAMNEGLVENNPVIGLKRPQEKTRERVLDFAELRLIWNALEDDHYGAIIKLLMLTGQRAGEIAGLSWSEIHDGMILLPAERSKNKRAHLVPLSGPALEIISAQPKRRTAEDEPRDLIFGYAKGPLGGWSGHKKSLNERIKETNGGKAIPHWTPHDLRRSFATHAAEIGIQPHIIEAVLNHISGHRGGVAGIYNRATYDAEKKTALDRWAEHLMAVVEGRGSNVTPIRRTV
jgi:integrase